MDGLDGFGDDYGAFIECFDEQLDLDRLKLFIFLQNSFRNIKF